MSKEIIWTPHQKRALEAFYEPDTDVNISVLYRSIYGAETIKTSSRAKQMRMGPTFAVINAKLFDPDKDFSPKIIPGRMKRTYRLQTKED